MRKPTSRVSRVVVHAGMSQKERAIAGTTPPNTKPGRYRAPTRSSPSSRASDYADVSGPLTAAEQRLRAKVGITRRSAYYPG